MKLVMAILSLLVAPMFSIHAENSPKLPPDAANALHSATNVVLYSLEPLGELTPKDKTLHGVRILGETKLDARRSRVAINAFESAIATGATNFGARCFEPRHALRVSADGQTYDFMLCYECQWLALMRDDKEIVRVCAIGVPVDLNKLLTGAKIPLAKSR